MIVYGASDDLMEFAGAVDLEAGQRAIGGDRVHLGGAGQEGRQLHAAAGLRMRVAVNVSGFQFRQDDFAAKLGRVLKTHGLPPDRKSVV